MRRTLIALALCLAALAARADVIRLKNGNTLEGKIVAQNDKEVRLRSGTGGETVIQRHLIAAIELGETPMGVYTKRAAELRDDDPQGHFALADYCIAHNLRTQAVATLRRGLTLGGENPAALARLRRLIDPTAQRQIRRAAQYHAKGQYAEAETPLLDVLTRYPESTHAARAHHLLAVGLAARQQYDKAFTRWSRALAADPGFVEASEGAAHAAIQLGRWNDAIGYTAKALKGSPAGPKAAALEKRLAALRELDRLEKQAKGQPADATRLIRRGQLLTDLGLAERGFRRLEDAYQAGARDPGLLNLLADHYERAGQVRQALELCDELSKADPTDHKLVLRRARLRPLTLIPKAFATIDRAEREDLLERITRSGASFQYIEQALRESTQRAKQQAGRVGGSFVVDEVLTRAAYLCYVPTTYDPRRPWPLVIALHRDRDQPKNHFFNWETIANTNRYILLFPTARKQATWRFADVPVVLSALRHAVKTYHIDTNRVFLSGTGSGGLLAWSVALRHPDRFAALILRTAPLDDVSRLYLPAAVSLPVYQLASERADPSILGASREADAFLARLGVDRRREEVPGHRHPAVPELNTKVLEWLDAKARNPYPRRLRLMTFEFANAHAFWVRVEHFAKSVFDPDRKIAGAKAPFGLDYTPEQLRQIYLAEMNRTLGTIGAAVQPGNRINVVTKHIGKLTVSLSDELVDLDKPVRITVNGKLLFRAKVQRSLAYLFETARLHHDPRMCYSARVLIDVRRGSAKDPAAAD